MKGLCIALVGFALTLSVHAVEPAGSFANPGFDEPKFEEPPECDEAAGWGRWGSWANRHTNQATWKVRNGTGMIAYQHWESDSVNAGWFQDVTNLSAGALCRFSIWARWQWNCNAGPLELRVEPYGGGAPYRTVKYGPADIHEEWTYITVHARLPPTKTGARVVIQCNSGFGGDTQHANGGIEFDDANLSELRTP